MSCHRENRKNWSTVGENTYSSDEMDALVRWVLRDSVAGEEPSPEVWGKIRARLEQPEAQPCLRKKRFLSIQLSWLVQLVVLGILILVAFGLSLGQEFEPSLDDEYVVNNELTSQSDCEEAILPSTNDDMLSGYYFFRLARELTVFDRRLAP